MRSSTVKLLHEVGGRPVISHVVASARAARCRRIVAVLGVQATEVRASIEALAGAGRRRGGAAPAVEFCTQRRQLGTAHAVLSAESLLGSARGTLMILNGDVPLVRPSTLRALLAFHRRRGAALTVLTTRLEDPSGYGRILRARDGSLDGIREQADLRGHRDLRAITEVNAGLYCAELAGLFPALKATSRSNAQREYYLPDLVHVLKDRGHRVEAMLHSDSTEVLGINSRMDLATAVRVHYRRRAEELMAAGVTLLDPDATFVDAGVKVGLDTVIYPMVRLEGRTRVGSGCVLRTGTRIADSIVSDGVEVLDHCVITESSLGKQSRVGPFAHLRPGTRLGPRVRIGNFVETKKAALGAGSKANHLTYLGDAEIGRDVNVGAGTITCNYDGWDKHKTVLRDDVFIGSDTQLVAPVRVGRGAFVGAGATVTKDVPADALALSRPKQQTIKGWAERKRRQMAARRGKSSKKR
jgi:bifunctional UDP-N-acetylglucosamine pyrophosphorylase/glucosamine-1-phosphate N-acetyltransferase